MRTKLSRTILGLIGAALLVLLASTRSTETALAAPAPTDRPATSDPVSERERGYLPSLHRSTVEIFVARPQFGVRRTFVRWYDELVLPPKDDADQIAKTEPAPPPAKKGSNERDGHFKFQDLIAKHHKAFPAEGEGVWQLRKVQLVGLVTHAKPVVYDTDKVPGMKETKEIPTRDLDTFEKTAIEELRKGETLHVERHGNDMRVMGPIYAGKQCAACHERKGQMLGGFTYQLERVVAKKTPNPK